MNRYHAPPPPDPDSLDDIPIETVELEAQRQFDEFYGGVAADRCSLGTIREGIWHLLKRGVAKCEGDEILFWDPVDGYWREYDAEYNEIMLECMHSFRRVYSKKAKAVAVGQPYLN